MNITIRRAEPEDWQAVRLYKKFGFEMEGTLRRYAFRDGTHADAYAMARLRSD